MRKFFTFFLTVAMGITSLAANYTGNLTVTVNGESSNQDATIGIGENSGIYTLTLKNFFLVSGEERMPVGNIIIDGIKGDTSNGITMLYADRKIQITNGDDPDLQWMGPLLGEVPIKMITRFNADGYLMTDIDIDMQVTLQQTIQVHFDNTEGHYQMPNADFEQWTDKTTEPKNWHGFKSAKGKYAGMASSVLEASDDIHPGASGQHSATIISKKVLFVIANGTMTNGQLNAEAMAAADTKNHSETDLASTAVDKNGDPFYTKVYARPDSVKLWMKFRQETPNEKYPYATFSSIITDGTYYQDPEDKDTTYTNVVAKAQNQTIGTCEWRQMSIPFDYQSFADNNAEAKAILVTISTNATPGQGGDKDQVWVDDIELVYDAAMTDLKYKGATLKDWNPATMTYTVDDYQGIPSADDFSAIVAGQSAVAGKVVETTGDAYIARISVVSGDLKKTKTYTVTFPFKAAVKGDVNRDGVVNVSDVTCMINMILGHVTPNLNTADMNGDGSVDENDVKALIGMILKQQ